LYKKLFNANNVSLVFEKRNSNETRPVTMGCESAPRKLFALLEKCLGHSLKLLDSVQKIWAPLEKHFAPPGVPSWLWA